MHRLDIVIHQLKEGDQKALSQLYDLYADALYGIIIKIVKKSDLAEEVLQDTFLKVWKNRDRYNPEIGGIYAWMYRIARNSSLTTLDLKTEKKQKEIQELDSTVYTIEDKGNTFVPEFMDLKGFMNKLEKKYKDVIELAYYQGFNQAGISKALNIPLGTVKSRIKIGLRHLKEMYLKDEERINRPLASIILLLLWI